MSLYFRRESLSFRFGVLVLSLFLSSCNPGGNTTPQNPTPSVDLEGTLTAADGLGIFKYNLKSGIKERFLSGTQAQHTLNGETIFVRKEGSQETFIIANEAGAIVSTVDIPFLYGGIGFPQYLDPALSPDGKLIAFAAQPFEIKDGGPYTDPYYHLYVMTREGTVLADLRGYAQASWTPSGQLVFAGSSALYDGETGIYISTADLKNPLRLDGNLDAPNSPSVSPDGTQIVFENSGVWLVNSDGSQLRKILTGDTLFIWPSFSPDGSMVAVSQVRGNSSWLDLKIVPLTGTTPPFTIYTDKGSAVDASARLSWW